MTSINRIESNARLSRAVVHNGVVYLAGITATDCTQDIRNQTRDVLQKIEERLSQAGSDKDHILSAQIWLANIVQDFDPMNDEWSNWLGSAGRPARATCQVAFDDPSLLIEVIITAAVI
ncbi:RidA family protein [Pseudomonas sp. 22373]|uniref:RidA family protein n=1 Tax=unclassified Pseudomonas TaxID=196821 RepID=UPI00244ABB6C|nr:RidA family protein [Pseudomonas sp. GD03696]EKT4532749.1 RidA family protein [Pseudomonas putida]MDH1930955.1 RidA family protein [Pseudomonas sp. GD03696]